MSYLFAVLAAICNSIASVQQRRTGRVEGRRGREMSLWLVVDLVRNKTWLSGILAVMCGFLLQAAALMFGELASVQPVLAIELPITIALAHRVFGGVVDRRQWFAFGGMTLGLAGLILFLAPAGGHPDRVSGTAWLYALIVSYGVLAVLVWWGRQLKDGTARAGVYGAATGGGFGVTAALMAGATAELKNGVLPMFASWQVYLMAITGVLSIYLLQNAVAAGRLVAAQPGFTLCDPIAAIVWGTVVFGETVRRGWFLAGAVGSFGLIAASVLVLSSSPWLAAPEER